MATAYISRRQAVVRFLALNSQPQCTSLHTISSSRRFLEPDRFKLVSFRSDRAWTPGFSCSLGRWVLVRRTGSTVSGRGSAVGGRGAAALDHSPSGGGNGVNIGVGANKLDFSCPSCFRYKTVLELLRGMFVLKLSSYQTFVDNSLKVGPKLVF